MFCCTEGLWKISDDFFFLSHRPQISNFPPYFRCFSTFPPCFAKIILYPPTFTNFFPPVLRKFTCFLILYVYFPPTLTMMHLCTTQCTYWTPLQWCRRKL